MSKNYDGKINQCDSRINNHNSNTNQPLQQQQSMIETATINDHDSNDSNYQ